MKNASTRFLSISAAIGAFLLCSNALASSVQGYSVKHVVEDSPAGDTTAYFYASVKVSPNDVDSITLAIPQRPTPVSLMFHAPDTWDYYFYEPAEGALATDFPDGTYTFTVTRGATTEPLIATLGGKLPSGTPNITDHSPGDYVDETKVINAQWTAWPDPQPQNASIQFGYAPAGSDYRSAITATTLPVSAISGSISANTLKPNASYDLVLNFVDANGSHATKERIERIQVHTTYYQLTFTKTEDPAGNFSATLFAELVADTNLLSVTLSTPTGEQISLFEDISTDAKIQVRGPGGTGRWSIFEFSSDLASFQTRFPDGQYTLTLFNGINSSNRIVTVGGAYPTEFPSINAPSHQSLEDYESDVLVIWDPWLDNPPPGSFISGSVDFTTWTLDTDQSTYTIGTGSLYSNENYSLDVRFNNLSADGLSIKATRSFVEFATGLSTDYYNVEMFRYEDSPGNILYDVNLILEGVGIGSIDVDTTIATLPMQKISLDGHQYAAYGLTQAQFDALFPDDFYTFNITYYDSTTDFYSVDAGFTFPQVPTIVSPANNSIVDPEQDQTFIWQQFLPIDDFNSQIEVFIYDYDTFADVYFDFFFSDETTFDLPAFTLEPDKAYLFMLQFETFDDSFEVTKTGQATLKLLTGKSIDSYQVTLVHGTLPNGSEHTRINATLSGVGVAGVELIAPGGESFTLQPDFFDPSLFVLDHSGSSIAEFDAVFSDGDYDFVVTFADNSTDLVTETVGGTYPPAPNLTAPANYSLVNGADPLQVAWDQWTPLGGLGSSVEVIVETGHGFAPVQVFLPNSATTFDSDANVLSPDNNYYVSVGFRDPSGPNSVKISRDFVLIATGTAIHYEFLEFRKTSEPAPFGQRGKFQAELSGAGIKSVTVTPPGGSPIPFSQNEANPTFAVTLEDIPIAAFNAGFADGSYVFDVTYFDDSTDSKTVTVGGSYPPDVVIKTPLNNSVVDPAQGFNVTWTQWDGTAIGSNSITASIEEFLTAGGEDVELSHQHYPSDATLHGVPRNTLSANKIYEAQVEFDSHVSENVRKATRSSVKIFTGPRGFVQLNTTPSGAELISGGSPTGLSTPFGPLGLAVGTYNDANFGIILRKDGFEDLTIPQFTITADTTTTLDLTMTAINPVPAIASLDPSSQHADEPAFSLTLNGSNFIAASQVKWNGSDRTTHFVSPTQLTADILVTDLASAGTADVTVVNPAPGGGTSNTSPFTILPPIIPPVITSSLVAAGTKNVPFTYTITADNNPTSFDATPLPAGLALDGADISGTPTAGGAFSVTLTATNSKGFDTKILQLSISNGATNQAPTFTSAPSVLPAVPTAGSPASFSVAASDPDGDTIAYSWNFGDDTTGTGPTPTHTFTKAGIYAVVVTITDGAVTDTRTLRVPVNSPGGGTNVFDVQKAAIKFNFAKQNGDAMTLLGIVPVPIGVTYDTLDIDIQMGSLTSHFELDAKGKASTPTSSFKLTAKASKGSIAASPAKFTYGVKKITLFPLLTECGFTNETVTKKRIENIPVLMSVNSEDFLDLLTVLYTAKVGKSGSAKK